MCPALLPTFISTSESGKTGKPFRPLEPVFVSENKGFIVILVWQCLQEKQSQNYIYYRVTLRHLGAKLPSTPSLPSAVTLAAHQAYRVSQEIPPLPLL